MKTSPAKRFRSLGSCLQRPRMNGESGFTVLELSIVLTIISLITVMAVTSGIAVIATARQTATVQKMTAIDSALMAFRVANDRIPCPADMTIASTATNYGVEAASPGLSSGVWYNCVKGTPSANFYSLNSASTAVVSAEGAVPTIALGLPNDFMYDGWGNRIRYAVDTNMTTTGSFSAMPAGALCGPISICDSGGVTSGACYNAARSSAAIYALISHGPNGYAGYTQNGSRSSSSSDNTNEQNNCHYTTGACPTLVSGTPQTFSPIYVQQAPSVSPTDALNVFDDIVTYKERWQMQTQWDRQGTACPAIWVADQSNNRVQKFDMNGNYLMSIPSSGTTAGSANGQFNAPNGVATDNSGNLWVTDVTNARVQKFTPSGQWLLTIGGTSTTSGDSSSNCSGIATSTTTAAAISNNAGYCGQDQTSCACATGSGGNGEFNGPGAIVVDASNNVWVGEGSRIQKFNSNGQWLMTVGGGASCTSCTSATSCSCSLGSGNGEFAVASGLAVDPGGNIWVGDRENGRIQKFNSNGQWLLTAGGGSSCTGCVSNTACSCTTLSTANGFFWWLYSIANDANGNIWVADNEDNRLEEFSNTGTFLTSVGGSGGPPGTCTTSPSGSVPACPPGVNGQFFDPTGIAVDANGNLWVVDSYNHIQKLSNIGGVWTWQQSVPPTGTSSGTAVGHFNAPEGIAIAR